MVSGQDVLDALRIGNINYGAWGELRGKIYGESETEAYLSTTAGILVSIIFIYRAGYASNVQRSRDRSLISHSVVIIGFF